MTGTPFSLLLPIYSGDRAEFLRSAFVSSVNEQTVPPAEVVLVVDGPVSDELSGMVDDLVATSPVVARVLRLSRNQGLAAALAAGLDECRFEVVARMDADDVSLPSRFERQLQAIETGLDLVGAGMFEFATEHGAILGRRTPPVGEEKIARYARFHDPFNHPTVVFRREAVAAAGGYQPLGLMEDCWLFARMLSAGARVDNLPEPLLMYRVSDGAYARRGGFAQLKAEIRLQRAFRATRFTTRPQAVRNIVVRGGYRLVPESMRRFAYRRLIARGYSVDG